MLVESGECIFDAELFARAHGFESLDPVAREAFVNHIHIAGDNALVEANRIINEWNAEMKSRWPDRVFRIYRHTDESEIIIRFHLVRSELPNWCEQEVDIITVSATRY
jgi:hypothetical protein